jgi:hypothetical protein
MELVVDDARVRQVGPDALGVGLPHVQAHGADRPPLVGRQRLGEEPIQRLALALPAHPQRLPRLQVAHDRQELVAFAEIDLIHPQVPQRVPPSPGRPAAQRALVHAPCRLGRQTALRRHPTHRRRLTGPRHGVLQPRGVPGVACDERQALGPHPAPRTADAVDLHPHLHLPRAPRQVPEASLRPAVDHPPPHPAPATHVGRDRGGLADGQPQRAGRLVRLPGVHPVPRQP